MANQDDYMKTALRLPRDLHAKLMGAAEATGKSLNAEMIARLEASFTGEADNAHLLVAIARLNLDLATAEADKLGLRTEASNLAISVQQACQLALKATNEADTKARKNIEALAAHARPYIHRLSTLEADIQARVDGLRQAAHGLAEARGNLLEARGDAAIFAEAESQIPPSDVIESIKPPKAQGGG